MIKSILLAVDGSVYTDAQVKHCVQLARAFQARISVLTVVDIRFFEWAVSMGTEGFVPVIPSAVYQEESKKMLESKADAVLKKCAAILRKEKIDFEAEKLHGPPADVIEEKSYLVDLLIIGARGEFAKWTSKFGGATLEVVVRQCNKPIFITSKEFKKISKMLIAYDGSDKANKALQLSGFVAENLQVPVTILSVSDNEQKRNRDLQNAETYLNPYDVDVELMGVHGNPEKNIVQISQEKKCDLIIMGAFGHSRFREAILGSTTEQVMRTSKIPLLLSK
ncbi:universal stress protein [candidate division KSB1 bacterium]|nr:universal stress protein [candidate division KSB1 bacterium]NIR68703.1 universal stress protein [candidate division KSB1 bacterium]NIS25520.1 universal stress protein [candidate division KSB1 bacterium]NIT72413.1 universal stress protein [candidate division KSB1 bacterium]NIU26197.1 universal stress protein [candidate division KSB1 bacterium]